MATTLATRRGSDAADRSLVARCADRDVDALRQLFDRHSAAVYGCAVVIAKRTRGLRPDDLAAASFLELWRDPASALADRRPIRAQLLVTVGRCRSG
jgi:hypothetical protein